MYQDRAFLSSPFSAYDRTYKNVDVVESWETPGLSDHVAATVKTDSTQSASRIQLHDAVIALLPLLLGGQLIFWVVFLPIGLRGDTDFSIFYTGGSLLRTGYNHQLYDYKLQLQFEREHVSQTPAPYNHLPYEALLFVPVSLLSYETAYLTFLIVNVGFAILSFSVIREPSHSRWLPAAVFISYFPIAAAIGDGQDSIMLLLIAGSACWLSSRKQEWLAGAVLALGMFRFTIVLPLVALLLLWKRWRFAGGFAAVAVVLLGLSAWMVGPTQIQLYAAHLLSLSGLAAQEAGYYSLSYAVPRMMNLRGIFANLVTVPHWGERLSIAASFVLLLWVAKRGRAITPKHQFALAVACSILVSYHLFVYDLSILLIPMMAVLGIAEQDDSRMAKIAVLTPLVCVPIGLLWRPFLVAVPLLVFLWMLTRVFDVQTNTAS